MKDAIRNMNKPIEKILLALLLILSPSLLFGNATVPANNEVTGAGSSIIRKGWISAPAYTQEWLLQGTRGERLMITASPISGEILPEIYLIFRENDTVVASSISNQEDDRVLDHELEATGTYIVAIRDQGMDNQGGYEMSLEKIAAPESARQTAAAGTVQGDDEDESGLSGWEIGTLVAVGTVLTVFTGPFAPLAMMVVARVAVLFPV